MISSWILVKLNEEKTFTRAKVIILIITSKLAIPGTNAIDLKHSKLINKKKKCCYRESLYFYCDQASHQTLYSHIKLISRHVKGIQDI